MLIIEGSDNTGKTTMAKRMVELCPGTSYEHMSRPSDDWDFCWGYHEMINSTFIRDRFHLGGIVYHHEKINKISLSSIEQWLRDIGSLIIIMYCSDESAYKKKLQDGRKQMFTPDLLVRANRTFLSIVHKVHPLKPHYDFAWDISPRNMLEFNYPNDNILKMWISEWLERKRKCSEKS